MPPNLDIYVVSKRRNRESVVRFIEAWVDREKSEDRGDEQLMLLPLGLAGGPSEDWDWEPAETLSHIVQRGLDLSPPAFVVYLTPLDPATEEVILAYTTDNRVIFGASLDDADEKDETLHAAKRILHRLIQDFDADFGYVACEEPPPLVEAHAPPNGPRILYTWSRPTV